MVPPPACPWHSYTWIVPITWKTNTSSGSESRYWLTNDSGTMCPARAGSQGSCGHPCAPVEVGFSQGGTGVRGG